MRSRDSPRSKRSPMREEAPSPAAPSPASSGGKRKSRDSVVVEEKWVPFEPSDRDVVSTKIRTWNSKHPANVYYSELVKAHVDRVPPVDSNGHSEVVKGIAGDIIDELTIARGGRFLKLREGDLTPTECVVMTRKQITIKVVRALRELHAKVVSGIPVSPAKEVINTTKHISVSGLFFEKHHSPSKAAAAAPPLPPPSKSKTSSKGSGGIIKTTNTRKSISPAPPASQSESETESVVPTPPPPKTYFLVDDCLAKKPLDFYLKLCINSVCNFIKPDICYQALDQPLNNYTLESEPDKDRLMRLQLRHRYVAAQAGNMTAIDFTKKLLCLWNCTLQEVAALDHTPAEDFERNNKNDTLLPAVGRMTSSPQAPINNDSTRMTTTTDTATSAFPFSTIASGNFRRAESSALSEGTSASKASSMEE